MPDHKPENKMDRRRALRLLAATAATPLLARIGLAHEPPSDIASIWSGTALGADARLVFAGTRARTADHHIALALAEVERLEQIFSLYRTDSELANLNRDGLIRRPTPELRQVLHVCRHVHALSSGLFDPTIETIWRQSHTPCDAVAASTNFANVRVTDHEIAVPESAALTLNGIAQGYITDRVTDLLRRAGYARILVDMGETRTLSDGQENQDWRVTVRETGEVVRLGSSAISTSSAKNLALCPGREISHIVEPATGLTPRHWRSVTVRHPSATWADALSTAFFLMPPQQLDKVARLLPAACVNAQPATMEDT